MNWVTYTDPECLPTPTLNDLLTLNDYGMAQGSNASLSRQRDRMSMDAYYDDYGVHRQRTPAQFLEETMEDDELSRQNRERMGLDDDLLPLPSVTESIIKAGDQEMAMERAGQGRWGRRSPGRDVP